jgi:hypothetical protein
MAESDGVLSAFVLWDWYDPGGLLADAPAIGQLSKRQSPQLLAAD